MDRFTLGKLLAAFLQVRPRLEAVARARTGNRALAEDLIQDTWSKLEAAQLDGPIDNPAGFIIQVANNTVTDHLRKERRRGEIDAELSELLWENADPVTPERALIDRERLAAVREALDELPQKTRDIFLMNRIDRIPHRRIAEMLGMSDNNVYYHVRRALERLAELRDDLAD